VYLDIDSEDIGSEENSYVNNLEDESNEKELEQNQQKYETEEREHQDEKSKG
jgi:hypothetical protein